MIDPKMIGKIKQECTANEEFANFIVSLTSGQKLTCDDLDVMSSTVVCITKQYVTYVDASSVAVIIGVFRE